LLPAAGTSSPSGRRTLPDLPRRRRTGAPDERGSRPGAACRFARIRRCSRCGQRGGDPRRASWPALWHQRPSIGPRGAAGRLGSWCCRTMADASRGGHRGGKVTAHRAKRAGGRRLRRDRHGLRPGHGNRTGHLPAALLVAGDQARDRLQHGGVGGSYRGRMAPLDGCADAATQNWLIWAPAPDRYAPRLLAPIRQGIVRAKDNVPVYSGA